jgi:hypothetical protein
MSVRFFFDLFMWMNFKNQLLRLFRYLFLPDGLVLDEECVKRVPQAYLYTPRTLALRSDAV